MVNSGEERRRERAAGVACELEDLRGVGPVLARKFRAAGISDPMALLRFVPRALRCYRRCSAPRIDLLGELVEFEVVCIDARRARKRGPALTEARFRIAGAPRDLPRERDVQFQCKFYGQRWLAGQLAPKPGSEQRRVLLRGRLAEPGRFAWRIEGAEIDAHVPASSAGGGLRYVPRYTRLEALGTKQLRNAILSALEPELSARIVGVDSEPQGLRRALGLPELAAALRELHLPSNDPEAHEAARRRLALIEAREHLASLRARRSRRAKRCAHALAATPNVLERVYARLPHALSEGQQECLSELLVDLARTTPMARLLHGDVGSGKTMVAMAAMLVAAAAGCQAVMLAPTSVLAAQHVKRFREQLASCELPVAYLASGIDAAERRATLRLLQSGRPCLVIGTHALLSSQVQAARLGLLVIDEQQRFGVRQRAALAQEVGGYAPHVLVMSATPIPRTQATALYGDLDVSVLRAAPSPRAAVVTELVDSAAWPSVRAAIVEELRRGGRVYVVCPRITSSIDEPSSGDGASSALATHRELSAVVEAGIVHGKQKREVRERAQSAFAEGRVACLVATTLVEVGVDVPEATWMVVRDAERLGLSSLHQLRGRVGRGSAGGRCILVGNAESERLRLLERCSDGFEIAEADLRERGAGDLIGRRQHGHTSFRCLEPARDLDLMQVATRAPAEFAEALASEKSSRSSR